MIGDELFLALTEPEYEGAETRRWTDEAYNNLERTRFVCDVCYARPDLDGERQHGKGCYVLDEDGGGSDYFEIDDVIMALLAVAAADAMQKMPPPKEPS